MTSATLEPPETGTSTNICSRVVDACRQASRASHDARLLKSLAADALEDGLHTARRAMKSIRRSVEQVDDLRDAAVSRVRRQPLQAVSMAFCAGIVLGTVARWIGKRPTRVQ